MSESPQVSVIIASHNEGDNLVDMVRCIVDDPCGTELEVVVVDDGSTDGSGLRAASLTSAKRPVRLVQDKALGVARARNMGARCARGELLVFMDGHCYGTRGWLPKVLEALEDPCVGLAGPACANLNLDDGSRGLGATWFDASLDMRWLGPLGGTPYAVPLLPGFCHAMRRRDFETVGGYDNGMSQWGGEDLELALRVWLLGFELVVQPAALVYHLFRERIPYRVDPAQVLYNKLRLAFVHFNDDRFARVIAHYREWAAFQSGLVYLLESDASARRRELRGSRVRDDDLFVARFGCAL